ncbi:sensor histidine kinase [Hamadaea sp. NPDC051192]|uniref:sensor histidine kinase n=1 Tax=Hamadaea sp. NPDC051192 TaxID=3154940 RepID=UPI00341A157F
MPDAHPRRRLTMPRLPQFPPLLDVLLAVGYTTLAVLIGREEHNEWLSLDTTGYVLTGLANLPVAFRRRFPVAVVIVCGLSWLIFIGLGYFPALNAYGSLVALYTVTADRPRWMGLTSAVALAGVWVYSGLRTPDSSMATVMVMAVVIFMAVWKFGDNARKLSLRNVELAAVTERLHREQADRARRAVADERMRIAGELHDIVAHHMSVIAVQAGTAGYVFDSQPDTARSALSVIAGAAREGNEELRRILSLLRAPTGGATEPPQEAAPGVELVERLADRMRAAGVPTEVEVLGPRRSLPAGLDLCAYRVIQESLTNVLKHAGEASATVTLDFRGEEFLATVADDGASTRQDPGNSHEGHGLIGMRERARLYGGSLAAGPRPGGGFQVVLTLPTPEGTTA